MSDARAIHLPDLPNAGYATLREKQLSDAVMMFMREVERDRLRLLTIVIEGKEKWRTVAGDLWRGLRIGESDGLLDSIYDYFTIQAAQSQPAIQRALLDAAQNPPKWRDLVVKLMPKVEAEREYLRLTEKWSPHAR